MVFIVTYLLLIVTMKVLAYLIMIPRESLLMHDCCCFCVLSFISQHWKFLWASIERRWAMLRAWELNCKRKKAHTTKARSFKGAQALQVNKVWSTESSGFMLHFRDSSLVNLSATFSIQTLLLRGIPIHQSTDPFILWRIYTRCWGLCNKKRVENLDQNAKWSFLKLIHIRYTLHTW